MGKDKDKERDKDRDKDKEKKKDKKEKKKERSHKERSSRHRHRRHGSEGGSDEERHSSKRHHRSSPKRDRDRHREEKLKRSRSPPDEHEEDIHVSSKRPHLEEEERKEERKEETSIPQEESGGGGGGAGLELSIEETNKLRLQLGLKPLQVETNVVTENAPAEEGDEGEEEEAPKKKEDVHVPAKNIGDIKKAEKIRERIEMMKETRGLVRKLGTVRGLGEERDETNGREGSASDWVKRMREKEKEKKLAEQRARLLEEMDEGNEEEEEEEEEKKRQIKKEIYSAHHLAGLTVEHKGDRFQEGKDVVLTLKDKQILDNEDDVLVNVNMIDDEKGQRNIELRKTLPGYQPYDEEFDEYGNPITRSLLYKYDEEIEGQKVNKFVLGESGDYKIGEVLKEKERARDLLQQKAITLDVPELSLASEYYTTEEMTQFRKRKKRKKKEKFKVEDLVSLESEGSGGRDHGSRHREKETIEEESIPMETDIKPDPSLLDETDSKVDSALERTRRLLSRKAGPPQSTGAARVASMLVPKVEIKTEEDEEKEQTTSDGPIIIDTTSEFCRQIGEEESAIDEIKVKQERDDSDMAMDEGDLGGWAEIDPNRKEDEPVPEKPDVLELEAKTHLTGVAAALQMASKKGFIDVERENVVKRKGDSKTIIHGLGTRDWEYERDRGRERDKDKDSHGREITFCEKKDYVPDVKIEYVDDKGKLLTAKEAFRHMSHKFHGKGSGKKKTEKLIKRRKEEILLSKADAGDTPLQSLEMLRKKQEFSQSAFVVLTGQQQQTIHTTELAKRK